MGFPLYGICFCLFLLFKLCICGSQHIGGLSPGFEATQTEWSNNNGLFLLSNSSVFGFGFYTALDVHFFLLVVIHISSARVVWTANRGKLINGSDKIMFKKNGNVQLQRGNDLAWSTNTSGQNAKAMELRDSGNLVLLGDNGDILWQSFSHPTDTLLPGQEFSGRMNLKSFPKNNLNVYLELKFGDLILYAGYETPQTYWSLASDTRKTNNSVTREVHSATIVSSAWNFYDQNKTLLWQFIFSGSTDENATWAAILGCFPIFKREITFLLRHSRFPKTHVVFHSLVMRTTYAISTTGASASQLSVLNSIANLLLLLQRVVAQRMQ